MRTERNRFLLFAGLTVCILAAAGACTEDAASPAIASCLQSVPAMDQQIPYCPDTKGGGKFGSWSTEDGVPVFVYTMDPETDSDASYFTTESDAARRHWHMAGNGQS